MLERLLSLFLCRYFCLLPFFPWVSVFPIFPFYQCFTVNSGKKHDSCCCNVIGGAWLEIKIMTVRFQRRERSESRRATHSTVHSLKVILLWLWLMSQTTRPASSDVKSTRFLNQCHWFCNSLTTHLWCNICESFTHSFPRIVYTHTSAFEHPQMSTLKHMCAPAL